MMPFKRSKYMAFTRELVADQIFRPTQRFFRKEASSSILLIAATLIALIWANSQIGETYHKFWHTEISLIFGKYKVTRTLVHWINDGFMTLFFFTVGLEMISSMAVMEQTSPHTHTLQAG